MMSRAGILALIVLLLNVFPPPPAQAEAVLPPLRRPALLSEKAPQSVLLDVTGAGDRLIAVGERGHILVSADNGTTWRQKPAPVSVTLTAVGFASPEVGWAVGHSGVVLNTEDGGDNWHQQLDGHGAADLVMASVTARKPAEEGQETFQRDMAEAERLVADGADKPFLDLCFTDRRNGFILGAYNLMFRTMDGGRTWAPWSRHTDNPNAYHLYRMLTVGHDLYVAGELGLLLRSDDRGQTFQNLPSPYEGSYFGLIGLKSGLLIAYGLRGHAFQSADRGATWRPLNTGAQASITDAIELKDGRLLLVTQSGQVLIGDGHTPSFSSLAMETAFPFAAAAQAKNGDLILVGARGVRVVLAGELSQLSGKPSGDRK